MHKPPFDLQQPDFKGTLLSKKKLKIKNKNNFLEKHQQMMIRQQLIQFSAAEINILNFKCKFF